MKESFQKLSPLQLYLIGSLFLTIGISLTEKNSISYWIINAIGLLVVFFAIMKHFKK